MKTIIKTRVPVLNFHYPDIANNFVHNNFTFTGKDDSMDTFFMWNVCIIKPISNTFSPPMTLSHLALFCGLTAMSPSSSNV